ncbi:FkbM family methyltransferase [Caulobacter sp. NIBR2454]|uniref:FkbM family methyltransferase n=1 Tax=Caulobacter sp. NIBR2454 TaxID=3015996 RepID=UPI0022B6C938|nr:FkbM family methyltransferase [Caulobacter sp. NIBR2454]
METQLFERLKLQGYTPATLLDIGANVGMFSYAFLQVYPHCVPTMIEPNPHCEERLAQLPFERHMVAASNENGEAELFLTKEWLQSTGSSLYRENSHHFRDEVVIRQPVPKARLDDLLAGRRFDFVKIDTQGAELDVLQGGRQVIGQADYVLVEVSLADYNPGAGRAEEIFAELAAMGFVTMEPLKLFRWQGEREGKVVQVDCLFERRVPRPTQGSALKALNDVQGLVAHLAGQRASNPNFRVLQLGAPAFSLPDGLPSASFGPAKAPLQFDGDLDDEDAWRPLLAHVARHGRFSYALCTHVLPRLANPGLLLSMSPLVAEAGFISTPSRQLESLRPEGPYRGYLQHRWILDQFENRLTLAPKLGLLEHAALEHEAAFAEQPARFELQTFWRGALDIRRLDDAELPRAAFIDRYMAFLNRP